MKRQKNQLFRIFLRSGHDESARIKRSAAENYYRTFMLELRVLIFFRNYKQSRNVKSGIFDAVRD